LSIFRRDQRILDDEPGGAIRARFQPVASSADLDGLFERAGAETVFLFLHDPYCPISSSAFEEVEQVDADVFMIDVSRHSALGREVQLRTGIRHESPQAIVFRDGAPTWHASHGRIRVESVRSALDG
jgi:bacillithiol system protein YtxJ